MLSNKKTTLSNKNNKNSHHKNLKINTDTEGLDIMESYNNGTDRRKQLKQFKQKQNSYLSGFTSANNNDVENIQNLLKKNKTFLRKLLK